MSTAELRNQFAALQAERDALAAKLAKRKYFKKKFAPMSSEEFRSALDILGPSIVGSAEAFGLSRRHAQKFANDAARIPDPVAKLIRLAIRTGLTANDLKTI